jgi:superfamily I DNA/RNA helicase
MHHPSPLKAILLRTNQMSHPLEATFTRLGLPYNMLDGTNYKDRAEVQDLLAYLHGRSPVLRILFVLFDDAARNYTCSRGVKPARASSTNMSLG